MALDGINHSGSGDFTLDIFDVRTSTTIDRMMANYNDVEYLKNKRLSADIVLNVDLVNQKYTFGNNTFSINDFNFGFEGFIEMLSEEYDLDIKFFGSDNSVKSILSLIPGAYKESFKDIQAGGLLDFKGYVRGSYQESQKKNPSFNVELSSTDGYVKYPDLPESISNIQFDLKIDNPSGVFHNTMIHLRQLHMDLGNNPLDASLKIYNLSDYEMQGKIKTFLNLTDVLKLYPIEDMDLSGKIDADLSFEGIYDTLNHTIPVSGNVDIMDLNYTSKDLPEGFRVETSKIKLSTERINVNNFKGAIGKSDLVLEGFLSNYLDFILDKETVLTGKFNLSSDYVDLNEWMVSEEKSQPEEEDTSSMQVIKVPENIDFVLDSRIRKVMYDNLELNDFQGQLIVREGVVQFNEVGFNTLGGLFTLKGSYDTRDEDLPAFDFNLSIKDLSIPKSYAHFMTIQQLAPIAQIMEGNFSSDFKLNGKLEKNFTPDLSTLSGKGLINIAKAAIKGSESKVISGIATVSKLKGESTNVGLANVILNSQIQNGRVFTQPFDVRFGDNKALIAGSSGLDGSLDYKVKLDVPPEVIKTTSSLITSLTGKDISSNAQDVKLNLNVKGNYDSPKISIVGAEVGESGQAAEEALKAVVEEEKEKAIEKAEEMLEAEKEKAPEEVKKIIEENEDEIEKAKNKLMDFFKKDGGS
jgi:hypothetical protein